MKQRALKCSNLILLIGAALCLVIYDIFGGLWLKGVTSSWFVILGAVNCYAARHLDGKHLRFFVLMEAGLICGMLADVLLGIVFLAGVGIFALGHILYLVAFCTLEKTGMRDLWFSVPPLVISVFMIVGTPWVHVDDPVMRTMLLGYAVIISLMLGKAVANLVRCRSIYRWLLAVGSVMFWFSDLMLLIDMFGQSSRIVWILCSYMYWPAQNILAHALYHGKKHFEDSV